MTTAIAHAEDDGRNESRSPGGLSILFADDSRATALPVIAVLRNAGHRVIHAHDGQQALELFLKESPDFILMDVVMPVMDGIEATRRIKALEGERWVPLIMMTSLDDKKDLLAGLAAGADDYLAKPIDFDVLQARINSMRRIALLQRRLYGILENASDGIITIDERGTMRAYNRAAERIFGYAPNEVLGRNVSMLMPMPQQQEHDGYLARYLAEGRPRVIGCGRKVRGLRKDGATFPMHLAVTEVRDMSGVQFIGLVRDISAEEAAREKVEFLAWHDALTGLANRARFNEALAEACARKEERPSAVLFLDLDGFKPINDRYGHDAGDAALVTVAKRLRHGVKDEDFVARLGGDEFVVLLAGAADGAAAVAVGQRLLEAIGRPMELLGHTCALGASIGVALIPAHADTPDQVLSIADGCMYEAKRAGKNCVILAKGAAG